MPRYLISFDDGAMDHIADADWPEVARASHAVVHEAKAAGIWIFGCGLSTIVSIDGHVSARPAQESKTVIGGLSIIEVSTRDKAHLWAALTAAGCRCAQEVREIMFDPES